MADETHKIVMDCGTYKSKVGFAHEEAPRDSFPTAVGHSRTAANTLIGREAHASEEKGLRIRRPVEFGVVTNWDDMQEIWGYMFDNVLQVDPTEYSVLNTETPQNPRANRERACELMFETFDVPYYFAMPQPILALYASGRVTGLVIESGHASSCAYPVYEGTQMDRGVFKVHYSGDNLTYYLSDLLSKKGYNFSTTQQLELVRDLKEQTGYIAVDYESECQRDEGDLSRSFRFPDGQTVTIGAERFMAPEALFQPSLIGQEHDGLHVMAYEAIMKSSVDVRRELYGNVLLAGGSTLFPGFDERLKKEILSRCPDSVKVEVLAPPDRKYFAWVGGTILCTLTSFQEMWITKDEFEDIGPSVAHRQPMH